MVGSAPPIYSRLYQEIANGMWGYFQALRVTQVPLPMCVTQMATILVFVSFVYVVSLPLNHKAPMDKQLCEQMISTWVCG